MKKDGVEMCNFEENVEKLVGLGKKICDPIREEMEEKAIPIPNPKTIAEEQLLKKLLEKSWVIDEND